MWAFLVLFLLTKCTSPWRHRGRRIFISSPAAVCHPFCPPGQKKSPARSPRARNPGVFVQLPGSTKFRRLLFTPESRAGRATGKSHRQTLLFDGSQCDTETFHPAFRERTDSIFQIGYVGRLDSRKECPRPCATGKRSGGKGIQNFQIVFIGQGADENWLRQNMRHAEFKGWLMGKTCPARMPTWTLLRFPPKRTRLVWRFWKHSPPVFLPWSRRAAARLHRAARQIRLRRQESRRVRPIS